MEQKSLRVLEANTTFFSKITTSITKLLIPTKVGLNSMLITIKRNSLIKSYDAYCNLKNTEDAKKKELISKKYEDSYALYLEAIDKYIMDSVYTKVKNNNASDFERGALSKYYEVTRLKEKEYLEYKQRKQKYLLELDYNSIKDNKKAKEKYLGFYISKMDGLYKGILKNYSIQLSDQIHSNVQYKNEVYNKIFDILEDYVLNILPLKLEVGNDKNYDDILKDYEEFQSYQVGKLYEKDYITKNLLLLGISRSIFTHSLPLVAAEQCYIYLLKQTRDLIASERSKERKEKAYKLLINLIEQYNIKLLSTKIYWDKPENKEEYKKFWNTYNSIKTEQEKEILFIKYDLKKLLKSPNNYSKIIQFYKEKLVSYGAMRSLKNSFKKITGRYEKKCRN